MSHSPQSHVLLHDYEPSTETFLEDALVGMRKADKQIPCKYFYDARGCELFEQICELDEYYPTRTEVAIMEKYAADMAQRIGPRCMLIEYGSGSSIKTRILLDHLQDPVAYVPVDIAREHLCDSATDLARHYPNLEVLPVCADFTETFSLPASRRSCRRRVVYFPGSTIGNFEAEQAARLLADINDHCDPGGGLLIGIDLQKDLAVLEAAYNDAQGVTAAFNKNLLRRANRELDADFQLHQFRHRAWYDAEFDRIEMQLVSLADQTVRIDGEVFRLEQGETISTEYSHKYDLQQFRQLALEAGLHVQQSWTDSDRLFAVVYLTVGVSSPVHKPTPAGQ